MDLSNSEARLLRLLQFEQNRQLEHWLDSPDGHAIGCVCHRPCVTKEEWLKDRLDETKE